VRPFSAVGVVVIDVDKVGIVGVTVVFFSFSLFCVLGS